ncbi:MAG: L,D-transpeptidase family protein [Pseudomonadota bacterium]
MKNRLSALLFIVLAGFAAPSQAYDKDYFGETKTYRAAFEDTLIHLARDNDLGFVELRAANPKLDAWIPGKGAKIILPQKHLLPEAPRKGIVINLAEMRIYYFKDKGAPPVTFPISVGREGLETPTGSTTITRKKEGPTWRPTERMRKEDPELPVSVPPGPENPLGTHALYLGWPQYLIHGTNKPYGIGRRVSSGCMRMYPEDVREFYSMVPIGTLVTVVDQPVKVGWVGDDLYVEVSPTQEQSLKIEEQGQLDSYEITKEDIRRINEKAGGRKEDINWEKVRAAVRDHKGYPIKILGGGKAVVTDESAQEEKSMPKKQEVKASKEEEQVSNASTEEVVIPPTARSITYNN